MKMGETERWTCRSHAKVNLYLVVLGKRPDGFHDLETVMHELDLHDTIEITPAEKSTVSSDVDGVPAGEDNLIIRGLRELQKHVELGEFHFHVSKKIPMGGGLAGGSTNAVCAMRCVLEHTSHPSGFDLEKVLHKAAADIGSDTAFFVYGGTALCTGRGECVEPVADRKLYFNLFMPGIHCNTGKVFSHVEYGGDLPSRKVFLEKWESGDAIAPINHLLTPCLAAYPEMLELHTLFNCENLPYQLSGSGSTFFSCHESRAERDDCYEKTLALKYNARVLQTESRFAEEAS